jgi:1-acyl-sn-glycerol-3-phosphate acyltransferase
MGTLGTIDAVLGITAFAAVGVMVLLHEIDVRTRRLRQHMDELCKPGFLPPPPTVTGQRRQHNLSRFLTWLIVGRVKVEGLENLAKLPEGCSYQITPNHSHYADVFVMPLLLKGRPVRYVADAAVMGGAGGFLGLLIAPMGAFAANRKVGIEVLNSGQGMVIFPEGWTYLDGVMGIFRRGAVNMCRISAAESQKSSYLVPAYLKYGCYPGAWIKKLPIRLQYAVMLLAFPYFRQKTDFPVLSSKTP